MICLLGRFSPFGFLRLSASYCQIQTRLRYYGNRSQQVMQKKPIMRFLKLKFIQQFQQQYYLRDKSSIQSYIAEVTGFNDFTEQYFSHKSISYQRTKFNHHYLHKLMYDSTNPILLTQDFIRLFKLKESFVYSGEKNIGKTHSLQIYRNLTSPILRSLVENMRNTSGITKYISIEELRIYPAIIYVQFMKDAWESELLLSVSQQLRLLFPLLAPKRQDQYGGKKMSKTIFSAFLQKLQTQANFTFKKYDMSCVVNCAEHLFVLATLLLQKIRQSKDFSSQLKQVKIYCQFIEYLFTIFERIVLIASFDFDAQTFRSINDHVKILDEKIIALFDKNNYGIKDERYYYKLAMGNLGQLQLYFSLWYSLKNYLSFYRGKYINYETFLKTLQIIYYYDKIKLRYQVSKHEELYIRNRLWLKNTWKICVNFQDINKHMQKMKKDNFFYQFEGNPLQGNLQDFYKKILQMKVKIEQQKEKAIIEQLKDAIKQDSVNKQEGLVDRLQKWVIIGAQKPKSQLINSKYYKYGSRYQTNNSRQNLYSQFECGDITYFEKTRFARGKDWVYFDTFQGVLRFLLSATQLLRLIKLAKEEQSKNNLPSDNSSDINKIS